MLQSIRAAGLAFMVSLIPLGACAAPSGPPSEASRPVEASQIAAVRVHADWCPNCRALDPKLERVIASDVWDGVTFVRIDYTRRDRDAVFAEADSLGIGEAIRTHFAGGIKTGLLLLVDIDSQAVVDTMTHRETEAAITARIRQAVSAAP